MRSFKLRNVNNVWRLVMTELLAIGEREESRNGPVLVYPEPVCVTYTRPWERVLFSERRRANPFFHLFESFWMLGGRQDASFLNRYVSDFGARFAEDTGLLHGAYGFRWRNHFWLDQLEWAIDLLLRDPQSRRAVIQMYDPPKDSIPHGGISPKDIPCNTQIYLRLRQSTKGTPQYAPETPTTADHPPAMVYPDAIDPVLDLTVCCRSNDAVWGAYGANAVHFTVLQEYLAWRLDVRMGSFHQLSNNLHVYDNTSHLFEKNEAFYDWYSMDKTQAVNLFHGAEPGVFEAELGQWLEDPSNSSENFYNSEWPFTRLLIPMSRVHDLIKQKEWTLALDMCEKIQAPDWRMAAVQWIKTRKVITNG